MYGLHSSERAACQSVNATVAREIAGPSTVAKGRASSTKPKSYKSGADWRKFVVRLNKYFDENSIEKDRKPAVLLANICSKTYTELKRLCHPRKPNSLQYDKLCGLLDQRLAPPAKTTPYRGRVTFYELKQVRGERVFKWFERVKKAAACCSFGKLADDKVKDRFVTGLCRGPVLDRLCAERPKKSMIELVRIAIKTEKATDPSPKNPSPQETQSNTAAAEPIAGRAEAKAKNTPPPSSFTPSKSNTEYQTLGRIVIKAKNNAGGLKNTPSSTFTPSSLFTPSKSNTEDQTLGRIGVKAVVNADHGFKNTWLPSSSTMNPFTDQTLNTDKDGILKTLNLHNEMLMKLTSGAGFNVSHVVNETASTVSSTESCRVCGRAKTSRFNSDINCCNACIQFYRKSNKPESKPDFCANNGLCHWTACQSCRYQKCLAAGIKDALPTRKSKGN